MGTYVTADGLLTESFEDAKDYWETAFKSLFGNTIDLDSEEPFGQLVGILSSRDASLWEVIEEIYLSRDKDQASGVALDAICAETGITRISASGTFINDVLLKADIGTVIPITAQIRQGTGDNSDKLYTITDPVTVAVTALRTALLTIQTPGASETFTITLDSVAYSFTTDGGSPETAEQVATALASLINTGAFTGGALADGGTVFISQITEDFSLAYTTNIDLDAVEVAADFQGDTPGAYPVPENTLDTIATPISGWDEVRNPSAGQTGRDTETDSELRIRQANTLSTGNATDDAIANGISNDVDGVTAVSVTSNRDDITDSEGRPPHSFETVVSGGLDQDILDKIWEKMPSGIQSYGNTSGTVTDSQGQPQTVSFSRATDLYIHVIVRRSLYSEEDFPDNGDELIKQAIVDWSLIKQTIGVDVIRQRLSTPIYSIEGIEDIEIELAATTTPSGTPSYAEVNIPISGSQKAAFDVTRITVEAL